MGLWHTFSKEDRKLIRKDLQGKKKTGLATPEELSEWSHKTIQHHLDTLKEHG